MKNKYNIIVIGSGPGGCVAALLAAERGLSVLMIEEGNYYSLSEIEAFSSDEMKNKYKNGGITLAFGKTKINYVEGKCVGGGSEVNSGLYHRIPEDVIQKWEIQNEIKFDRALIDKSYSWVEKEINVSYMKTQPAKASLILKDGSDKLGWECKEIPRWHKYTSNEGVKQSMTETLIPKYLKNGGELLDNSKVLKIERVNSKHFVKVLAKDREIKTFQADYIFMAAGSIHTPHLLLRSGIKRLIGTNLKLHPTFKFIALFKEKINFPGMGVPVHQVKEFSPDYSLGCSISNKHYLGVGLSESMNLKYINDWEKLGSYYSMISPEGRGSISTIPFFKDPFVRFKLTNSDYEMLYKSIYSLGKVLFEAGATMLFPSVSAPLVINNLEDIRKIELLSKSKLNLMTIHLFSSVPLGGNKKSSPLNPYGQLWDDKSIYVFDGSMLCDSPSVNPQGAIMAIAKMNADKFLNNYKDGN